MKPKYKRIMLKLSGEVLLGDLDSGISRNRLESLCKQVIEVHEAGVEIALVIGGGNFWRYRNQKELGLDRVVLDQMGIMATVMNGLAMQNMFEKLGVQTRVSSAIDVPQMAESYRRRKAVRHLEKQRIVICAGGTGSTFFTTDSAAALRSLELGCDILLKATKVDGIYDKDPERHDDAKKFDALTYQEVLEQDLKFMDQAAIAIAKEGKMPVLVFNLEVEGNIAKAVSGEEIGTLVH
jgi:uridylate kinase